MVTVNSLPSATTCALVTTIAVVGDEEAGALAHAAARDGTARASVAVVVVEAEPARLAEAAEELVQRMVARKVVEAFHHAAVGDRRDLGLHLHADHGRLHLLDDCR